MNETSFGTEIPISRPSKGICKQDPPVLKNPTCQYIRLLAKELRTSEKVVKNTVLKSKKWANSAYELLAKIIREDLTAKLEPKKRMAIGTSLSARTLQKVIGDTYRLSYPIDPRKINTLNKLVLFLGYTGWDDFVEQKTEFTEEAKEQGEEQEVVKSLVREGVYRELSTYRCLPMVKESYLDDIYIKDGPAYNRIMGGLVNMASKKQIISNDYNPSTFEILEIEVRELTQDYAQIRTMEYWILCWWCTTSQCYVKRYKDISEHFYILTKSDDRWMIRTNASKMDLMGL